MKTKEPKDWKCQECGKKMTAKRAMKAITDADGCPGCGGVDIDVAVGEVC